MDKCTEYKSNTKQIQKLINKCSGKIRDKSNVIEYLSIDGIKKTESTIIADEFAKFFSGIGKEYSNKIKKPINSAEHYLSKIRGSNKTLFLYPTTHVEIDSIIKKLHQKRVVAVMELAINY